MLICLSGLKDATRRDNQMKMEMGLKMPSKVSVDRNIRMSLCLTVSEKYARMSLCPTVSSRYAGECQNESIS